MIKLPLRDRMMDRDVAAAQARPMTVLTLSATLRALLPVVQKAVQVGQGGQAAPRRKKARARPAAVRTLTELIEIAAPAAEIDGAAVAAQSSAAAEKGLSVEDSMPSFFSSPDDSTNEVRRSTSPCSAGLYHSSIAFRRFNSVSSYPTCINA